VYEARCRMCNTGTIVKVRVYRASTPAVVIGYVLLVASALVLVLSVVKLLETRNPVQGFGEFWRELEQQAALVCGFFSLLGGLLGLLLVKKKDALRCNRCGVEVPISLEGMYDGPS
jgi:uncharacterized membrane protein (UPF0136 family)